MIFFPPNSFWLPAELSQIPYSRNKTKQQTFPGYTKCFLLFEEYDLGKQMLSKTICCIMDLEKDTEMTACCPFKSSLWIKNMQK